MNRAGSSAGQAKKMFAEYSGMSPRLSKVNVRALKGALWHLGELDYVGYTAVRDGEVIPYEHKFSTRSRPDLAVTADGKQLVIIGGAYRVGDAGIEDL